MIQVWNFVTKHYIKIDQPWLNVFLQLIQNLFYACPKAVKYGPECMHQRIYRMPPLSQQLKHHGSNCTGNGYPVQNPKVHEQVLLLYPRWTPARLFLSMPAIWKELRYCNSFRFAWT